MSTLQSVVPELAAGYSDILTEALARLCGDNDEEILAGLLTKVSVVRLRVGSILYRQGEPGENLHVVLSGRLQVKVAMPEGSERIVAYPQPGDVVGEMALLSGSCRAATIIAVRDSTLAMIERSAIDSLVADHPRIFSNIARMIISRLTGASGHIGRRNGARTIMLVPLHRGARMSSFASRLRHALLGFGSVLHLDSRTALQRFNMQASTDYGRHLDACENAYDYLLLEADPEPTQWGLACLGYADKIVMLADGAMPTGLTEIERWLFSRAGTASHFAEIELAIMHRETSSPNRTRQWLAPRQVKRHHHVHEDNEDDIARIARFLTGHAVALVLAGGGARGFAHLGVIRALHEAGVAIDAVGGASFGALAATGLARGLTDLESMEEQRIAFSHEDPLGDYTIPIMSLVRGEHLNRVLQAHLPMDIEDLWLPFFAVSSDLSANKVRVHDRGPLWQAIRASVSLPAILPPTLDDGHLLVDGGVLNNLPVDVMRERMQGPIIAVDLALDSQPGEAPSTIPSGLDYLRNRILPGGKPDEAPTLSRIILQVTTMASRKEVQSARKLADLYLNPPLANFDFLDWNSMREIAESGYRYALPQIKDWLQLHPSYWDRASCMRSWQRGLAE